MKNNILHCGSYRLALDRPLVMGIINVTPDSFSDGGQFLDAGYAIAHGRTLIAEGADLLDIGGESTRPGAVPVSLEEELSRVIPVIEALAGAGIPLSVDTWKPEVIRAAIKAGAVMVNDVNALQTPGAMEVVAASDVAVCLMHKQNNPQNMQVDPAYVDVVAEVHAFLRARSEAALAAGIARERILLDPGFGFGKKLAHNLALLCEFRVFVETGFPVLAGLSRKSMLGLITGREVGDRLPASITAAVLAAQAGASVLRVHDVAATRDALAVLHAVNITKEE